MKQNAQRQPMSRLRPVPKPFASTASQPEDWGVARGFEAVPYPREPLEQLYVAQKSSRWRNSRHTRDLRSLTTGVLVFAIGAFVVAFFQSILNLVLEPVNTWQERFSLFSNVRPEFITAIVTSAGAAMAALFQFGKQRFSTVDVFSSEIAARMRILAADKTISNIIAIADPDRFKEEALRTGDKSQLADWVEPSPESQFENFHRRSADLGALGSSVVDHVTAFYSYQMAARDELRTLGRVRQDPSTRLEDVRDQVCNVIFMADLMAMSAIQALDDLIETREHHLYCLQLALCVGCEANAYLVGTIAHDDHRRAEIIRRNLAYAGYISKLKKGLKGTGLRLRRMTAPGADFL